MTSTETTAVPSSSSPTLPIPKLVQDPQELLKYGVCRVAVPNDLLDLSKWANELSQVTPLNMSLEAVAEYAFYRNILEEPDFPFDKILASEIGACIQRYFVGDNQHDEDDNNDDDNKGDSHLPLDDVIRLDDAFCVHYNMDQADTTGAKHTDPSDITVNICLEKSDDAQGSQVLFYGTKRVLLNTTDGDDDQGNGDDPPPSKNPSIAISASFQFLVDQLPGYATIHWGAHPHETLALKQGRRTNVVITYCFKDPTRSDVNQRCCCFDTS